MDGLGVALLAGGLAIDSCFVALAQGFVERRHRWSTALKIGLVFGGMQGCLAFAGWWAGEPVARWFAAFDHWIAFGLLAAIGVKTIVDAWRNVEDGARGPMSTTKLLLAGLATSIDALAAGFSLSLVHEPIAPTAIATTLVTAVGSVCAYFAARHVGARWERRGHVMAGLVLIGIGAHILFEHREQWLGP